MHKAKVAPLWDDSENGDNISMESVEYANEGYDNGGYVEEVKMKSLESPVVVTGGEGNGNDTHLRRRNSNVYMRSPRQNVADFAELSPCQKRHNGRIFAKSQSEMRQRLALPSHKRYN